MLPPLSSAKVGEYTLSDSRVLHVLQSEDTTLVYGAITIAFRFSETDSNKPEIKVDTDGNLIRFTLIDSHVFPSYGTTDFIEFGKTDSGETLFISFRVNSLHDKKVRSLEYSIFSKV